MIGGLDTFEETLPSSTEQKKKKKKKKKKTTKKKEETVRGTERLYLHLSHLWKGLSFKNWPFQSQQKMLPARNSIV